MENEPKIEQQTPEKTLEAKMPFLRAKDAWLTSQFVRVLNLKNIDGSKFQLQSGTVYQANGGTIRRVSEKSLPKKVRQKMKRAIKQRNQSNDLSRN